MPARQPLEMRGRYRFHSTRRRASTHQSEDGANFRRATRRRFSVRLSRSGKAWEDRPGRAIRHPLIPRHSTQVRDGRRALRRGVAFDLRCRSSQATSRAGKTRGFSTLAPFCCISPRKRAASLDSLPTGVSSCRGFSSSEQPSGPSRDSLCISSSRPPRLRRQQVSPRSGAPPSRTRQSTHRPQLRRRV